MKQLVQFSLLFLFLFAACKTEQEVPAPTPVDDMLSYIKRLGFRPEEIEDKGNYYLVDGDMTFPKNEKISPNIESHLSPDALETRQDGCQSYIGFNAQPNITIRIDASMAIHASIIQQAVAEWNNIPNCRFRFTFTTSTNQNILIRDGRNDPDMGGNTCADAPLPFNGNARGAIRVNRGLSVMESDPEQLRRTLVHELGHVLGLQHTNWRSNEPTLNLGSVLTATNILGTPISDPQSQMNGSMCGRRPTSLSPSDILAIQTIYPANAPRAGTVPVFRYFHLKTGDHFYTTNLSELGGGNMNIVNNVVDGYRFEGIGFFAFPSQVANTLPVFRYFNSAIWDHLYTTNFAELGEGRNGYKLESRNAFFVHPSQINGSVAVLRFFNGRDHFYTKNRNEFLDRSVGYNPEGTAFFAF